MELATRDKIIDDAVCIFLCANALRKGMNPSVLTLTIDKDESKLDSLALV